MTSEIWKDIPDYEQYYQVSNLGNVRSLTRIDTKGAKHKSKNKTLTLKPNGYLSVVLYHGNRARRFLAHRLVMLAFVGECPKGLEVHHIDHDKQNNRLDNLRYVTSSENNIEAIKAGKFTPGFTKGETSPVAKLTEKQVLEIRHLYATGNYRQRILAKMFHVHIDTIKSILQRRTWKHI